MNAMIHGPGLLPKAAWLSLLVQLSLCLPRASALSTAFTYQGRLLDGGTVAKGAYDLEFTLYSAATGGSALGSGVTKEDVIVTDGLFTTEIDFGPGAFAAEGRWLAVSVRPGASTGAFTPLPVRQALMAVPQSQYALVAGSVPDGAITAGKIADGAVHAVHIANGAINAAQLAKPPRSGTISSSNLPISFDPVPLSVTFSPLFSTTPAVTLSLETSDAGFARQFTAFVTTKSAGGFAGKCHLPEPTTVVVDTTANNGSAVGTSLEAVNGRPAISYQTIDAAGREILTYVRAVDASGTAWAAPVAVDASSAAVGRYGSLKVVNGSPAIGYYDGSGGNLKYVRAADATGAAWGKPVLVDSDGDVGQYSSLLVVNGRPAISYWEATSGALKFVRAKDADGTSWETPVTVDSAGNSGAFASMAIVNGNPAISYYDPNQADLRYVRATDPEGRTWAAPIAIEQTGNVGSHTTLAIVGGQPAISYRFFDPTIGIDGYGELRYVRASDANGLLWGTPVLVASGDAVGSHAVMAVVNGQPAICYSDDQLNPGKKLRWVAAEDAIGTDWKVPLGIGGDPRSVAMTTINGRPALSYLRADGSELVFVGAPDTPFTINWIALEP